MQHAAVAGAAGYGETTEVIALIVARDVEPI